MELARPVHNKHSIICAQSQKIWEPKVNAKKREQEKKSSQSAWSTFWGDPLGKGFTLNIERANASRSVSKESVICPPSSTDIQCIRVCLASQM